MFVSTEISPSVDEIASHDPEYADPDYFKAKPEIAQVGFVEDV